MTWYERIHSAQEYTGAISRLYDLGMRPRQRMLSGPALELWLAVSREWKRQSQGAETSSVAEALKTLTHDMGPGPCAA